jgi:hypothetical protein
MGRRFRAAHYEDRSGAIAAGGVSQLLAEENPARRSLLIQNVSVDALWINFDVPAVQAAPSFRLAAGAFFTMEAPNFVDTSVVNVIGPNAGAAFAAREA